MQAHIKDVVRELTVASDEDRITFPEVVQALAKAGVERYHADLVVATRTYFMPDGAFEVVESRVPSGAAPADLDLAAVADAVAAIQSGAIQYREFCARITAAGCVGYLVSLIGRRVIYYGRTGDSHTEWFPGAQR